MNKLNRRWDFLGPVFGPYREDRSMAVPSSQLQTMLKQLLPDIESRSCHIMALDPKYDQSTRPRSDFIHPEDDLRWEMIIDAMILSIIPGVLAVAVDPPESRSQI